MGFLDGFLGGVVDRRRQEELQNREDAQQSQIREDAVLQHLSTSDDPEIRALAVAGILDSTHPKRKQGGFGGWLGKVQTNPHMDRIRALVAQDQAQGKAPSPAAVQAITSAPAAGPAGASAAQPGGKSLTEVGSAPPSPTESTPGQDPTPETGTAGPLAAVLQDASPTVDPTAAATVAAAAPTSAAGVPQTGASAEIAAGPGPQASPAAAGGSAVGAPPPAGPGSTEPPGAPPLAVLGQPTPPVGAGPKSPRGDVFRSPETQIRLSKKAAAQGDVEGDVAGFVSAGFSEQEARAIVKEAYGRKARGGAAGAARPMQGTMTGPDGKQQTVFAIWDPGTKQFLHPDTHELMTGFQPKPTGAGANPFYGMDREGIAKAIYGKPFGQLTPEEAADVNTKRQEQLQTDAIQRGTGSGIAAFNKPIGVGEAQRTNTNVGATSAQYAGQAIPSTAEQDTRRGVEGVKSQLDHVKTLLGALPKQGELAGLAPGATLAIRRRSPQYRTQIAQLESALDNVVNVLARSVGQQRGAQTEQDASRAYNTVVAMKARLLDPLAGDTQESAAARIAETMQYLEVVLAKLPATPVPGAGAGVSPGVGGPPPAPEAAPPGPAAVTPPPPVAIAARATPAAKAGVTPGASKGAGPAGFTMVNGVLHKDGKPY